MYRGSPRTEGAHFAGLGCLLLGIILLIAPSAIHRMSIASARLSSPQRWFLLRRASPAISMW
jgi:hypothetical protein